VHRFATAEGPSLAGRSRTETRSNTNPNDTEANAIGRGARACVSRKSSRDRNEESVKRLVKSQYSSVVP
jgi:hypothetical protein